MKHMVKQNGFLAQLLLKSTDFCTNASCNLHKLIWLLPEYPVSFLPVSPLLPPKHQFTDFQISVLTLQV